MFIQINYNLFLICFLSFLITENSSLSCSKFESKIKHDFFPLRHCQRSNGNIIGLKNFNTLESCKSFALKQRGLAFNFSDKDRDSVNLFDADDESHVKGKNKTTSYYEELYNCQILACPESSNYSTIVNDSRYDYYSMYAQTLSAGNTTCLATIGIFSFNQTLTIYSKAFETCINQGGALAHILSETRTNSLSKLLFQNKNLTDQQMVYVGLNETAEKNLFMTSSNESIDCFRYRAWAPGQPKKKRTAGCVVLTTENSWRVVDCNRKLPFICEIFTSEPRKSINLNKECLERKDFNYF